MRLLTAICVAAVVVAFAVPAIAETQNVKVSGDIGVAHIFQHHIDLCDGPPTGTDTANENDNETFFVQQVGLNVEADLTDNVSTYVRLINERDWDADGAGAGPFDISLDEAYLTLKEMLYAPLTLKIGRQNIWLGKGFVIGNAGPTVWDQAGGVQGTVHELSDMTAFDAIRATLDYDPWTVDLIYAKIDEANVLISDDTDLFVANVGYKFTKYEAEAEAYAIFESDKIGSAGLVNVATSEPNNETLTIGLRGSFVPFDNMNVWAEGALQSGQYAVDETTSAVAASEITSDRDAHAFNLGGTYTFTDVRWVPTIGAEYSVYSGEDLQADGTVGGEWDAWNGLYAGKFDTYIAALRNITKPTQFDGGAADATQNNNAGTNELRYALFGQLNPMTDVTVKARYTYLLYDEAPSSTAIPNRDEEIGYEIDGKVTYDYTEDVTFTVAGALFVAGDYYESDNDDTNQSDAAQVISAVTIDF